MHPDVEQYIKDNPKYFYYVDNYDYITKNNKTHQHEGNKPLWYSGDYIYVSRNFQLFLANRTERTLANPQGDMGKCEALQALGSSCLVFWATPSGDTRNGISSGVEYPTPLMCNCPTHSTCTKKVGILLDIIVKSFTGTPANKASLCLWHENRDKYQFLMSFHGGSGLPVILLNNPEVKKALEEYTNTTTVFSYDKNSLKLIYEQNKNSLTCVGCGKPTYERPVLFTTIRYCDCIDGK